MDGVAAAAGFMAQSDGQARVYSRRADAVCGVEHREDDLDDVHAVGTVPRGVQESGSDR